MTIAMRQDISLELISARVARSDQPWEESIAVAGGKSFPFVVERSWAGPSGYYNEQWSIRRGMGDVIHQADPSYIFVRGIQSLTKHVDRVVVPIAIDEGSYRLVFIVEGYFMGAVEIQVISSDSAAA